MTYEDIKQYCLSKSGSYQACPFGPLPICFKVGKRIFLEWYPEEKITVRCEPFLADYYRQTYPGIVIAGYHCPDRQKPYKNTVYIYQGLEETLIYDMLDHSYNEALKSLTKKEREEVGKVDV